MPYSSVQTSSGLVRFRYTLSTPSQTSAKVQSINRNIPTLLFIHPAFISHEIFHPQFSDTKLRRFNLLALDTRCHGETSANVPPDYRPELAADDVAKFMDALSLPACHIFGVSTGSSIALELASSNPRKVLSLFLVSPLPSIPVPEVAEGLQEIYDCWTSGFQDSEVVDDSALLDAVYGVLQLGFNNPSSSLVRALGRTTLSRGQKMWTPKHFEDLYKACIAFASHPISTTRLERISCPIKLVHCAEDIAYPMDLAQQTQMQYQNLGIDAGLVTVAHAGHYGSVTHPETINPLLAQFILANHTSKNIPSSPALVMSPFEATLRQAGWVEDFEEDFW